MKTPRHETAGEPAAPVVRTRRPVPSRPLPAVPVPAAVTVSGLARGFRPLRKLEVGSTDDPVEVDADRVADAVVGAVHPGRTVHRSASRSVSSPGPSAEPTVGAAGGALSGPAQSAILSAEGDDRTPAARSDPSHDGSRTGADFGAVRVHAGAASAALNARLSAQAFTIGRDVFFRDGLPEPASPAGAHLLAHELAHVMQGDPSGRRRVAREVIRRNDESVKALKEILAPITRKGPEVGVQQDLVLLLEAAVAESKAVQEEAYKVQFKRQAEFDEKWKKENPEADAKALGDAKGEFNKQLPAIPPTFDKAFSTSARSNCDRCRRPRRRSRTSSSPRR